MENYKKFYDAATRKLLSQAADIDRMCLQHFDAQYTLYDITYVLRSLYADEKFRRKFVGQIDTTGDQFAPLVVPYHVGELINKRMRDMKTPNKAEFIKRVKQELDRR